MEWIILIGDKNFIFDKVKSMEHYSAVKCYDVDENRYCVEFGKDHIFYDFVPDVIEDYEDEISKIPFSDPNFIMMTYKSYERMKEVLSQDNFFRGIYVDNDIDLIIPIEEFIRLGMPVD